MEQYTMEYVYKLREILQRNPSAAQYLSRPDFQQSRATNQEELDDLKRLKELSSIIGYGSRGGRRTSETEAEKNALISKIGHLLEAGEKGISETFWTPGGAGYETPEETIAPAAPMTGTIPATGGFQAGLPPTTQTTTPTDTTQGTWQAAYQNAINSGATPEQALQAANQSLSQYGWGGTQANVPQEYTPTGVGLGALADPTGGLFQPDMPQASEEGDDLLYPPTEPDNWWDKWFGGGFSGSTVYDPSKWFAPPGYTPPSTPPTTPPTTTPEEFDADAFLDPTTGLPTGEGGFPELTPLEGPASWETVVQNGRVILVAYDKDGNIYTSEEGQAYIQDIGAALPEGLTDYQQKQVDFQNAQLTAQKEASDAELLLAQQRFAWEQGETRRQYESQLAARGPGAWMESAAYTGKEPVIQPWMLPMAPEQYGWGAAPQAGQNIPGWTPQSAQGVPELSRPSQQYLARMGDTAQQQLYSYRQARTGATPQEQLWRQEQTAPSGGYQGLTWNKG